MLEHSGCVFMHVPMSTSVPSVLCLYGTGVYLKSISFFFNVVNKYSFLGGIDIVTKTQVSIKGLLGYSLEQR